MEKSANKSLLGSRRPFWFSSLNYYFLTVGVAIASFFIIWGVLGSEEETPFITAGIVAGLILISSVILRELILRRVYQQTLLAQKRLDYNIKSVYKQTNQNSKSNRLTLERNKEIIKEIESKSKAAKSFGNLAEPHLRVFEMCQVYLQKSGRELEGIHKSSPRYESLRNGQEKLKNLHRFHLLAWASIESQLFIQTSKVQATMSKKLFNAQRALEVLDSAIQFYPNEPTLIESTEAVNGFIASIKVSHWMELAEKSVFKENYQRAINYYKEILFFLAHENVQMPEREVFEEKINLEIEELKIKNKRVKMKKL